MIDQRIEIITIDILNKLNIDSAKKIDVKKICKFYGIDVKSENLANDISGLFVFKDNKPFIRYNENEGLERRRFTIAHELGHFILHKDTPLFVDKVDRTLYRNMDSSTGEYKKEREANSFAASLLMPRIFIDEEINNLPKNTKDPIASLSKKFKVSEQAMTYRLANLGYHLGFF